MKRPSLLVMDVNQLNGVKELMSSEAAVYRELRNRPHVHLCEFLGYVVDAGHVTGFRLRKYQKKLKQCIKDEPRKFDTAHVIKAIKSAVSHLHTIGFCHNGINPDNIMFDECGNPVLLDFDSALPSGLHLNKGGTPGWCRENMVNSSTENDFHAIDVLTRWMNGVQIK